MGLSASVTSNADYDIFRKHSTAALLKRRRYWPRSRAWELLSAQRNPGRKTNHPPWLYWPVGFVCVQTQVRNIGLFYLMTHKWAVISLSVCFVPTVQVGEKAHTRTQTTQTNTHTQHTQESCANVKQWGLGCCSPQRIWYYVPPTSFNHFRLKGSGGRAKHFQLSNLKLSLPTHSWEVVGWLTNNWNRE